MQTTLFPMKNKSKDDFRTDAVFDETRQYRYSLMRSWDSNLPAILFIGLNPSTADEHENDPTIVRCMTFAKEWGYGTLYMCNLFAYRATNPKEMKTRSKAAIGAMNDRYLLEMMHEVKTIVCAWGNDGQYLDRGKDVLWQLHLNVPEKLFYFHLTNKGQPCHPLYLAKKSELQQFPRDYSFR